MVCLLGPDSMMVLYLDPLGKEYPCAGCCKFRPAGGPNEDIPQQLKSGKTHIDKKRSEERKTYVLI